MKYEVVVGFLWVDGVKHSRGDIIELADAAEYGVRVQPYVEPPKPAKKAPVRRKKAEAKDEDR